MERLGLFRTHPDIPLPTYGTKQSACFDLSYQSAGKDSYKGYTSFNKEFNRQLGPERLIHISPGDRVMVPTGLILDIPEGYSVRIHPRSGTALKKGLVMANCEGVIDSDYVEELYLLMLNTSGNGITLSDGDRIAQGEMIKTENYVLWEVMERPLQKTDRDGGFGSTGVQTSMVEVPTVKRTGAGRPKGSPNKKKVLTSPVE